MDNTGLTQAQQLIAEECDALKAMLLEKNRNYGNSFAQVSGVFSADLTPVQKLLVRIDDKLSRIKAGNAPGEDTVADLIGYLIPMRVLNRLNGVVP